MSDNIQYTNSKVQSEDFTSGWSVGLILVGLGVSLPVLYLGAEMTLAMGMQNALIAFGLSTLVLTVLCLVTTLIGNRSRLSTYMILRFPFGKQGAKIINLLIGLSLLGWFSVALEFLSDAIANTSEELLGLKIPLAIIIILGSLFITVTTIYGIRTLEKLANVAVPVLLVFLIYVVYVSVGQATDISAITERVDVAPLSLFEGTSALIGSSILMPVLMADFSRYIYNDKQSLLSVLGIAIGTPLVWGIAAILSIKTGQVDIIMIMKHFSLILPAFVLIFVSTWVTNATNLYSVALTFSTIIDHWTYTKWVLVTSVVGTLMALAGFSDYFIEFLNILAVFSPAIAAIYIIDFFYIRKQDYNLDKVIDWGLPALLAWLLSTILACCSYYDVITLSGAYFVDSFLIGGIAYVLFSRSRLSTGLTIDNDV